MEDSEKEIIEEATTIIAKVPCVVPFYVVPIVKGLDSLNSLPKVYEVEFKAKKMGKDGETWKEWEFNLIKSYPKK